MCSLPAPIHHTSKPLGGHLNAHSNHSHSQHSTVLVLSLSLSLALSAHSVAAFYLPPEPCVSYEPRKATDSTLPPTAAAGSGASCVFGGAVGSTAHEADTTHASNILLSVVGHSRGGGSHHRGRREREGSLKQLCSVFTLGGQLELKLVLAGGGIQEEKEWEQRGQPACAMGERLV